MSLAAVTACDAPGEAPETLTVYAAASLTDVFASVENGFEDEHPNVEVTTVYGGSADLAAQIAEGGPADVFASAHPAQMVGLGTASVFATNTLTLVVPTGNPAAVTGFFDLARDDLTSVICAPQVPCGLATEQLAAAQGVALSPSSQENSVTDVLGKVASGQADAGVVYVTDVARADGVEEVKIPGATEVANTYAITPIPGATHTDLATAYIDFVTGPDGRAVLADAGFGAP
ncbi:molybdate ABC transporter substrate-binding protein [Demequina sp. SO4-13]|uniref:molybdate ABC transporter substrate-binding protein n=1 Tax=Demequina sp. SO4-13 TaxID=3401027 RepID=UPI003AF54CD8